VKVLSEDLWAHFCANQLNCAG